MCVLAGTAHLNPESAFDIKMGPDGSVPPAGQRTPTQHKNCSGVLARAP